MTTHELAIHPAIDGFGSHDPSAVLFTDGDLAFGVEEGRLIDEKHVSGRFPRRAIRACLDHADIRLQAVERVVVPWRARTDGRDPATTPIERRLAGLSRPVPTVELYDHHRSHAASAFAPSGFDEALVVTADGSGGEDATVVWHADSDGLTRRRRYRVPNSLGYLYAAATGYLGYQPFGGEGKVMGLAPYGDRDPAIEERFRAAVTSGVDYDVTDVVGAGIPTGVSRLEALLDRPRVARVGPMDDRAASIARTVQTFLEETVVDICETFCDRLDVDRVCLAGGVALNAKANQRVAASPVVEETFVQPIAGDAGAPLGAAVTAGVTNSVPETLYWGPSTSTAAVEELCDRRGIAYSTPEDLVERVATRLAEGALVGWFQGRLEMGPRALGNRSILADPRDADARARVNAFVKRRASWRPFAPSLLSSAAGDYLSAATDAPYMIRTFDVVPDRREEIPAVIHPADGTTRPQTVSRDHNPRFHRLLVAFADRTGVPVLLNTSFNDAGDPIVATPQQALDTFSRTALDVLVLEDCLIDADT